jgi:chromosome segregation ATPase
VDARIGTEIAGIEKNIESLGGLKSGLEKLKNSSISKKEHEKALTDIMNQMAGVKTLVDGFQSEMKMGIEGLQKKIESLSAAVNTHEKTIKALQIRQTNLENEKIDLKTLRDAISKQEDQFNLANAQLKKEINALRVEVVKLLSQAPAGSGKVQSGSTVIEQNIE